MRIPTIHWNGTSKESLLAQIEKAYASIMIAQEALAEMSPHPRDYYTQEAGAYEQARGEHTVRLQRMEDTRKELEALAEGIAAQGGRG